MISPVTLRAEGPTRNGTLFAMSSGRIVFPSQAFHQSCIFVRAGGRVREPADLVGCRVGVLEYQMTAAVWIRGILADHYGVPVDSVTYVTGGLEEPGRNEKLSLDLPSSIRTEPAPIGVTLSGMLADGAIDAIHTARTPSTFDGHRVIRLFDDPAAVERAYFRETRIFPIMHTVVIKRDVHARHPWVARSLYKAFDTALDEALAALRETTALKVALPWVVSHAEEVNQLMGERPWAYGIEPNRHVLEAFLRYSTAQGLARDVRSVESLFVPELFDAFAI